MIKKNDKNEPMLKPFNGLKSKSDGIYYPEYYRNKDLKKIFGFSDNTIINYRDCNIIPYAKIGEIYLYPVKELKMLLMKSGNFELFKLN
jgi:hypothetical protein